VQHICMGRLRRHCADSQPVHHPLPIHSLGVVSVYVGTVIRSTFTSGDVNCRGYTLEFARGSSDTTFCHSGSRWPIRIACVALGSVGHLRFLLHIKRGVVGLAQPRRVP
jgi:hypothetical protein